MVSHYLVHQWLEFSKTNHSRYIALLDTVSFWLKGELISPLFQALGYAARSVPESLAALNDFFADILRQDSFPFLLRDFHAVSDYTHHNYPSSDSPSAVSTNFPEESSDSFVRRVRKKSWKGPVDRPFDDAFILTIKKWVQHKECYAYTNDVWLENRVAEILNEARDNVSNITLVHSKPRKQWDFRALQAELEPALNKVARAQDRKTGKPYLSWNLRFLKILYPSSRRLS